MNKYLLIFLAVTAVALSASFFVSSMNGSSQNSDDNGTDHTDCFQFHDQGKCNYMGCYWNGSFCEQEGVLLKKSSCPVTGVKVECEKYGCSWVLGTCIDP